MNRRDALKKMVAGGAGAGAVAASGAACDGSEPVGFAVFVRTIEKKDVPLTEAEIEERRRERARRRAEIREKDPAGANLLEMMDDTFDIIRAPGPPTKRVRAEPTIPFTPVGAVDEWNSDAWRYDPAEPGEAYPRFGCVPLKDAFLFTSRVAAEAFAGCITWVDAIEGGYHAAPLHVGDTSEYESLEWEVREVFAADLASPDAARPVPGETPRPAKPWPKIGDTFSIR